MAIHRWIHIVQGMMYAQFENLSFVFSVCVNLTSIAKRM